MFAGGERSATVDIVNRGDAIGVFSIGWVDFAMTPEGGLAAWDDVPAPWSVQPHVRYSPRRVTLEPGETQVVRIALRQDRDATEGEYYSHLRVLTLNDNVDGPTEEDTARGTSGSPGVTIQARTAIAIPVIWRNSQSAPRAEIESVAIDREMNQLRVDVRRLGNLSTRGYLHVVGTDADGNERVLADPVPLVIYPSLERRTVSVPMQQDLGAAGLAAGTQVIYSPDLEVTSTQRSLASYRITQ